MIAKRIKSGVYLNIDDIERDFQLMIKNAKVFNEPKSEVFQVGSSGQFVSDNRFSISGCSGIGKDYQIKTNGIRHGNKNQ